MIIQLFWCCLKDSELSDTRRSRLLLFGQSWEVFEASYLDKKLRKAVKTGNSWYLVRGLWRYLEHYEELLLRCIEFYIHLLRIFITLEVSHYLHIKADYGVWDQSTSSPLIFKKEGCLNRQARAHHSPRTRSTLDELSIIRAAWMSHCCSRHLVCLSNINGTVLLFYTLQTPHLEPSSNAWSYE